ncbi:MAG TPA: hypothetical protein VMC10_21725 [Stellaceae bacterium]|nr:hypothetical protein [Stellaceae bacterium]
MSRHALVFLANDRYYAWAVTFLESIRERNARQPLYCIPYDAETARIRSLRGAFDFEMVDADFGALDAFADRLFPNRPPNRANLRKYAALQIDCDEVAYFDIDMVLLVDPARLFGHVRPGSLDLIYLSTSPDFVYRRDRLAEARRRFPQMQLISAGAFITSRCALSIEGIIDTVESNRALYLELRREDGLYDQPVLNFALDCSGKRCRHIEECDPTLAGLASFRNPHIVFEGGRLLDLRNGREVAAVHWAGAVKRGLEVLDPRLWPLGRLRSGFHRRGKQRVAEALVG